MEPSPVSRSPPAWSRDRSSSASSSRSSISSRSGRLAASGTAGPASTPAAAGTTWSSLIVRFMIVLPPKNLGIYPPANRLP